MNKRKEEIQLQNPCFECSDDQNLKLSVTNNHTCDLKSACINRCKNWLEQCTIDDDTSSVTTDATSSISDLTSDQNICYNDDLCKDIVNCDSSHEAVKIIKSAFNKSNVYHTVDIKHGKKIHLGNVTNIYGPVHITQTTNVENTQNITKQVFLNGEAKTIPSKKLNVIERINWVAQPPLDPDDIKPLHSPAKFVIISHTATEDGSTQAKNVLLLRNIQTFHIESRQWNDIAYNFLIGCDGNVYKGRGWNIVGAHTRGYNHVSVGISFIGTFMNKLPPLISLHQAKALIKHGVDIGAIDENYMLVGHCQCSTFESPGRRLFQEIKTWDHWTELQEEQRPEEN